jgi:hypothetical protein
MDEEYRMECAPELKDVLRCTELFALSLQNEAATPQSREYYTPTATALLSLHNGLASLIADGGTRSKEAEILRGLKSVLDRVYFSHWKEGIRVPRTLLLGDMLDAIEILLEREYPSIP